MQLHTALTCKGHHACPPVLQPSQLHPATFPRPSPPPLLQTRTISPVAGRYYEFSLASDGSLGVVELDGDGHRLQLLDPGEGAACGSWGAELPVRLRELHSHWLSRWAAVGVEGQRVVRGSASMGSEGCS